MKRLARLTIPQRILSIIALGTLTLLGVVAVNALAMRQLIAIQDAQTVRASNAIRIEELSGMGAKLYQVIADTELNLDMTASAREWADVKTESVDDLAAVARMCDTPAERSQIAEAQAAFERIVTRYETQMRPALAAARGGSPELRRLDDAIDADVSRLSTAAAGVVESVVAESEAGNRAFAVAATEARTWSIVAAIAGTLLLMGTGWLVARGIRRRLELMAGELKSGAEQVTAASAEMAAASQSLSQGATEQASSLEETSASIEEMASMTRRNADHARQAAVRISETASLSREADTALDDLVRSMSAISEASSRVTKIVRTIDEIAFQTNILALNAAVEAARAGESGMGFAVVAGEVRTLAQRSAAAARDTAALVEASAASADTGAVKVQEVVGVVRRIAESAGVVKGLVDEVSAASHEQSQGIDQVRDAIAEMEKVTQHTAATAEERAAASEELNAHAEQSVDVVGRLERLVGRVTTPSSRRAVPPVAGLPATTAPTTVPPALKIVRRRPTAEEQLPLADTGTFGKF